jgi:murein DD-endopeptidase MepM/ murein hydrolase activator NlpD
VLRAGLLSLVGGLLMVPMAVPQAVGEESLSELQATMTDIQNQLNAAQARIEELRTQEALLEQSMETTLARLKGLEADQKDLRGVAIRRARQLYMNGNSDMLEALLGSADLADLLNKTEALSQVSMDDTSAFLRLARTEAEIKMLNADLFADQKALAEAKAELAKQIAAQQKQFEAVADDYERLKSKLVGVDVEVKADGSVSTGGMYCPVAGPVSFIDSWGYPRSGGRTHEGTDMMAAYGTPLVAITSGTITYASYDGSGGNMIFLSGDDGHQYWYMHNQQNLVTSGRVQAGQQIATVGDTGNAVGNPHLHFEYHPGGGAPVNPYPLVASLC